VTLRLAAHVLEHWREFDGWAAARGLPDPLTLRVARFINLVWFWMTDGADPAEVRKLEARVWVPPSGEVARGPWSADAEMAAFDALRSKLGK